MSSLNPFCFGAQGLRLMNVKPKTASVLRLNPFCFGIWGLSDAPTIEQVLEWLS